MFDYDGHHDASNSLEGCGGSTRDPRQEILRSAPRGATSDDEKSSSSVAMSWQKTNINGLTVGGIILLLRMSGFQIGDDDSPLHGWAKVVREHLAP